MNKIKNLYQILAANNQICFLYKAIKQILRLHLKIQNKKTKFNLVLVILLDLQNFKQRMIKK